MLLIILYLIICIVTTTNVPPTEVSQPCLGSDERQPLLFVSRLDGVITAIQLTEQLPVIWELDLGYPLVSTTTTLTQMDDMMFVPSLDGNLYTMKREGNQQTIQPYSKLEHLLNKEVDGQNKWVGGKDITTRGVTLDDGRVLYKCNIENCQRYNDSTVGSEPLLAVTDEKKTVRLVDMTLGTESWNWSIVSVDLQYVGVKHRSSCQPPHLPVNLNFDVEDGVITAQFKEGNFASRTIGGPLSQGWVLNDEYLQSVNMFFTDNDDPNAINIYLGQWGGSLYIQPFFPHDSLFGIGRINEEIFAVGLPAHGRYGKNTISWEQRGEATISWENSRPKDSTALANIQSSSLVPRDMVHTIWKPRYDYIPPVRDAKTSNPLLEDYDFWYIVEQMMLTTLAAVIVSYGVLYRCLMKKKPQAKDMASVGTEPMISSDVPLSSPQLSDEDIFSRQFKSRLEQDFRVIRMLGEGGFGKVIEAQHRISKHNYAIKIIKLPFKERLQKKVEREVAAMAKLEHPNILRYYTSWKECVSLELNRSRKNTFTSGSEVFDSGTSTKSSSPDDLISPNLASCKTFDYSQIRIESSESTFSNNVVFEDESTSSIVFKDDKTSSGICVQETEWSESSVEFPRSLGTEEDDSLIVFAEESQEQSRLKPKRPNLTLPLYRKVLDKSEQSDAALPLSPSSKSVTFSESWEESTTGATRESFSSRSRQSSGQESFLYIQMQLCSDHTLKEWLQNTSHRPDAMRIFTEIVSAVEYIHANNHIHRDIKPSNILFGKDGGKVKVADFGLATIIEVEKTSGSGASSALCGSLMEPEEISLTQNLGTKLYMSPELEGNSHYDYKVDIFALGIVFFELLMVFSTGMERVELIQDLRIKRAIPDSIDANYPQYRSILLRMIARKPEDRPTATELLAFFQNSDQIT